MTQDATWTAEGSPYVLDGRLRIRSGATLTIEPGTVVKFVPGSALYGELLIYGGRLLAQGTGGDPIVFTSYFDDSAGGDTDGGGRAPERGDWAKLSFTAPTAQEGASMPLSVLDNVSVRYGGEGFSCQGGELVRVGTYGKLQVTRSEFVESQTAGISSAPLSAGESFSVSHSRFADSVCGVQAQGGDVFNNIFEDTLSQWSLYSFSGSAQGLLVIGNWMYQTAAFSLYGTREKADARSNAFIDGVNDETQDQDHVDLRYNYWGENPPTLPGCFQSQTYIPALKFGDLCNPEGPAPLKYGVSEYFTEVLPFSDAPGFPEVGPGATLTPPGGFVLPLEQTFGGGCNCLNPGRLAALGGDLGYQHLAADPVNTATGSFTETFSDVALPAPGIPFSFTRSYNSLDTTTGPMGAGWTFGHNASLSVEPSGDVRVRAEDGQQAVYTTEPGGGFDAPPGILSVLTANGSGYKLTRPDKKVLEFNGSGQLTAMKDIVGQGLSFTYANGVLDTITDAAGRVVTLTYTGGLLTQVALPDGRHVDYGYTSGRLTSYTDMRGQVTTYTYDDVHHLLESAEDPNGHFLFRNTYHASTKRIVAQLDARGKETTFAWNEATDTSTMTDPNDNEWVEVYSGRILQKLRDPLGNTTSFGYDEHLNRTSVTDARNKTTTMTYDDVGNMQTRTAPAPLSYMETWSYTPFNAVDTYTNRRQKVTDYDYFADTHQLKRVTDPLGRETDFTYAAQGLLDTVTDPREKVTDFDYDADGNLTKATSPEGNITTFGYDNSGRRTSMTEARGNEAGANPAEFTTLYGYNNNNQLTSVTDPLDHETVYAYDEAGNLDTVTDAEEKVTDYDYYADNALKKVTDPRGAVVESTYDDNGNLDTVITPEGVTDYGYDAANRRTSEITPRGNVSPADPADFTWTYGYDANGNLETATHPTAGTTIHTYDELNRRDSTTDALEHETVFGYDENSNLTSVEDPLHRVTTFVFDEADQLDKVKDAYLKVTDYDYDASGNQTSMLTPLGFETRWTYDGDGRLATQVDPRGTAPGIDPDDFTTTYSYDAAGHLELVTDPLDHTTGYDYDAAGNLESRTDANTHTTAYAYDALNRLESVTGPATTNIGTTAYTYDESGNLHTRLDAKNHTTTWVHDLAGRLESKTTPVGTWSYEYDAAGNLTKTVTAAGNATPAIPSDGTITRSYDAVDRPTGIDYSDATPDVSYTYDELRVQTMSDGVAVPESYGYDDAGQLQTITRGTAVFDYDYDNLGRITKRIQPDGTVVNQTWDDDSRQLTASSPTTGSATYGYDRAGNPTTTSLGNGIVETRTFDPAGRLSEVVAKRPSNSVVAKHTYTLDPVGNPTDITRQYGLTNVTESYIYDDADRVTKACFTGSCSQRSDYTYDPVGNRLTENRVGGTGAGMFTFSVNNKDQLTQTSRPAILPGLPPIVVNYTYDDNGNQTSEGTTTYAYDLENRIKTATVAGATTSYTYDGNGSRLTATAGAGPTTTYTWDTNNALPELVSETAGAATRRILNGRAGEPIAEVIPGTGIGTGLHYLHLDSLGSVRAVTDNTAATTTRATYSYEAFGTSRTSPTNQSNLNNPIGFAGEYKDPATSLYHLRARDYDTDTGRFTALDPLAQEIRDPYVADYVYVRNQSTVLLDPSGLKEDDDEDCTDGPWYEEVGELICDTGEALYDTVTHPGDVAAGAGHLDAKLNEFSLFGLSYELTTGHDLSDDYADYVTDKYGVNLDGTAAASGELLAFEICTAGLGGIFGAAGRAAWRAWKARRATVPAETVRVLTVSERRALHSLEQQLATHIEKLRAYKANPDAFDNLGFLANAPSPQIRERIIEGRINHLETEIKAFQDQINKLKGGG